MAKNFGGLENILKAAARKGEGTRSAIVKELPLSQIVENDNNFFSMAEDVEFLSLVESIKDLGVLHPILVNKIDDPDNDKYKIISGHRRYRASLKVGKTTIPAVVATFEDTEQAELAMLDANFTARVLTPSDIAEFIKHYEQKLKAGTFKGRKRDYIGKKIGLSGQQVERYKAFGELDPEVQKLIDEEKIALTAAPYLKQLSPDEQKAAAEEIINSDYTDTRKAAQDIVFRKMKPKTDTQPEETTKDATSVTTEKQPNPIDERITQLNKAITDFVNHVKAIDNRDAIQIIDEAIKTLQTLKNTGL